MSTLTLHFEDGEEIPVHSTVLADSPVLQSMARANPVACFDDDCIVDPRCIAEYLRNQQFNFTDTSLTGQLNELHPAYWVARHLQIRTLEAWVLSQLSSLPGLEGEPIVLVENTEYLYARDPSPDLSYRAFLRTNLGKCFVKSPLLTWNQLSHRKEAMERAEFRSDVYNAVWDALEEVARDLDRLSNQWEDTMYVQTHKKAAPKRPVISSSSGGNGGDSDSQDIRLRGQTVVEILAPLVERLQKAKYDLEELKERLDQLMLDLQVKQHTKGE